jgi:hypothetical protein
MEWTQKRRYNTIAKNGLNFIVFIHRKYNLYPGKRTERKIHVESGSKTGPEQGLPAPSDELGNVYETLRNSVFIAYHSDRVFHPFSVRTDDLYPAGVQEE